jgi:hypothetical protein
MERTPESQRDRPGRTAAADRDGRTAGAHQTDLRPASVAQAGLQRMIAAGPRMTAQRRAGPGAGKAEKDEDGGLPANLRAGVEALSGVSMDGVKVNYNSSKPAELNALAYAQGREIHVASGQEQHLPHEAWHIAQQAQGRVRPTMQMQGGVGINDDTALEEEADVMGARALQTKPAQRMDDGEA